MDLSVRQIIALGGGGFSQEPDNLALDRYVLEQAGVPRPQVCFLGTASGDDPGYILRFYTAFNQLDCRPSHLPLVNPPTADIESFLLEKDILYVGGGNTRSMLALWREWGLLESLRAAYERGIVLAGISAGAICWFQQAVTDSLAGRLTKLDGLSFLPGSCCPHYDGESERRPAYHDLLARGEILPGYAVEDGAALHFVDGQLHALVSSRPQASAYFVEATAGGVQERRLENRYLLRTS